jgi:hypothetical protein
VSHGQAICEGRKSLRLSLLSVNSCSKSRQARVNVLISLLPMVNFSRGDSLGQSGASMEFEHGRYNRYGR